MRKLLVALIVVASYGNAQGDLPEQIRVITYNIHHGKGVDRKFDLPRIAKVVRRAT